MVAGLIVLTEILIRVLSEILIRVPNALFLKIGFDYEFNWMLTKMQYIESSSSVQRYIEDHQYKLYCYMGCDPWDCFRFNKYNYVGN